MMLHLGLMLLQLQILKKYTWGGDYVKPVVNASAGDYAFKLSADESP